MARKLTALLPKESLVDYAKIIFDDGSEYLLLPNLEMLFIRGPKRMKTKNVEEILPELSLF